VDLQRGGWSLRRSLATTREVADLLVRLTAPERPTGLTYALLGHLFGIVTISESAGVGRLTRRKGMGMYARIARFEGGSPEVVRAEADRVRRGIHELKSGGGGDPTTADLSRLVDRFVMLADSETGAGATVVFCETEDQLREVDRIMQDMSPQTGEGRRVSYDLYEVVLDESPAEAANAA
jgi:hypothetical protein